MSSERQATPVASAPFDALAGRRKPRISRSVGRFVRHQPLGTFGLVVIFALIVTAAAGTTVLPHDPNATSVDVLQAPSWKHWFGTDNYGRDYFARVVAGTRVSVSVGISAMLLGTAIGGLLGILSGYARGLFDLLFQRVVDALLALPLLISAMLFVAVFGTSVINMIVVLALAISPGISRIARAATISVMGEQYVEAATVIGAPFPRVVLRYIIPNILAPITVIVTTGVGSIILAEAGLSFLGLGIAPPAAEWGQMLSASRIDAIDAPWLAIYPGLAIGLAVLGFNLFGDAIRDALDPRLRVL
ncbi:hypothetical protein AYO38_01755 [bacterium SCGC AG-212-C10]|nr:hypothetical protein AYO38_01755 [bacterium SCGC AG-212-C10]